MIYKHANNQILSTFVILTFTTFFTVLKLFGTFVHQASKLKTGLLN